MTKNEMIERIREQIVHGWGLDHSEWIRETAEKIVSMFPDQKYDYEWKVPDENTPVDVPVYARYYACENWQRRYSAGLGKCWLDGHTSWTADKCGIWNMIVLADPDDLERVPPMNFVPKQ